MKRVSSLALIAKLLQLMIALGLLVIFSVLPDVAKVAVPLTTVGAVGFAPAKPASASNATPVAMRRNDFLC